MTCTATAFLPARRCAIQVLCLTLFMGAGTAHAQPAEEVSGPYVLRASTVSLQNLPASVRDRHDLPSGENNAILNVTVQFRGADGTPENRPAQVRATASNLYGVKTDIPMREIRENDMVSYMGVYQFLPREVLDFHIEATPEGRTSPLVLEYRDRLGRR